MKHRFSLGITIYLMFIFLISCSEQEQNIQFDNPDLNYEGRIEYGADAAVFSWSGTSVTMQFKGTGVSALLQDMDTANYYNVILDGEVVSKIHIDTLKHAYVLASGLPKGKHTIQLFKRTEWDKGQTLFYGFTIEKGGRLLPSPAPKKRKMAFYGNSITCGYGNEDFTGKDRPFGYFQNNYEAYGAITARHYNAQYHCIAKSGIGITVSWFPMIMSEMFDRIDATDSTSVWDFSQYTPDIVVVNLFQNDSWIVNRPNYEQFISRFGTKKPNEDFIINAYKNFIASLRTKHPQSYIICALGNMDATIEGSLWPGYIQAAVNQLNDDSDVYLFLPF